MDEPKRTNRLLIFLVPLGAAFVAVLLLLKGLGAPLPTPVPRTPTPDPAQEVVARVGEQHITFADWAVAFHLDALMSSLSDQPAPAASETLDRLVNDTLILAAAAKEGIAASEADAEARIALLLANWGLTEDQVAAEMAAIGLNREIGVEAIAHLLTVERYLAEVVWADVPAEGQENALADWLQTHRSQVGVEIDTRGLQPSLPASMPVPTATSLAASPLAAPSPPLSPTPTVTPSPPPSPTPTATPVLVSPLLTPTTHTDPPTVGQPAPDFTLTDAKDQPVSLSDYRDQRRVVIVFLRTTG